MYDRNLLVSVVVPAYNRAALIVDALESVWRQTYRPIELIVIDDGSTDDTRDRVLTWASAHDGESDFRVCYLHQDKRGANAARNLGIRHSKGELVAFLDSDDRWLPGKLERQVPILVDDPEVGGVYCGLRYFDIRTGELTPLEPRDYPQGDLLRALLVRDVTEGEPCWIVRKESLDQVGLFDESLPARLGWDLWIRLSAKCKIGCVPEVLVMAGNHPGERIRSDPRREIEGHRVIFNKHTHLRNRFPLSVGLAARAAMYRRRGRVYFHRGSSKQKAVFYQLMAICVWPFCFDSYAAFAGILLPDKLRQKIHIQWNRIFGRTPLAIRSF
jgi:glycosyltransferase involved in cell wall biosynthesis